MNIIVKGSHIEISEAIHDYIDKKVKSLEKFLSPDAVIEADMGKTTEHHRHGDIFRAELRIRNNGEETYVFVEKEDLYTAIDAVRLEAAEVLSSKKDKRKSLFKKGAQKIKSMFRSSRG
jgi:putative sigma-54 modulation protein